ncbi:small glutamine-rich tetratricopeptide repeat-containing protein alpha-like [Zerene cesonia]|uniref:small glutamine-rich tetratricopeptide repeat-containing protein alpha-like n=1 Tax=Zerene cesonia TaxID=33412 RepID=UPI0018E547B7|nr:small glutamine-rich tetratricopeptide repeat-containing protein alpha-like [Zerene cesonia]
MSEAKTVVAGIVNFLKQQLEALNVDSRESVEVAVQCIETAYDLTQEEISKGVDLLQLVRQQSGNAGAIQAEAEKLKNEGNESYKENLRLTEEKLARSERPAMDLGGLLQNPSLLNMATELLSDPNMQNLISGLMDNNSGANAPGGVNALLEAGQALAQQMQAANPELVEQLRRQMHPQGGQGGNPQPPAQ